MAITPDRIQHDIEAIASFTATPGAGASRPTFSAEWRQARDYVIAQAEAAGCVVRVDAAGNVFARPSALPPEAKVWLSGSHVDSVPNGGDFDGVVGVVVPLEVLRAAHEDGRVIPLELVIWAEEEGTTFGLGMLGSRAAIGELSAKELRNWKNADGHSYVDAGMGHGVEAAAMDGPLLQPSNYIGLVEAHIEQGAAMWQDGVPISVVTTIAGRRQYLVTVEGTANHAGSTLMPNRRDALAGAAEIIIQLENLAPSLSPQAVMTVGRIENAPNAINVISDRTTFTIDFRSPDATLQDTGDQRIQAVMKDIAKRRGLDLTFTRTEFAPVVSMDNRVVAAIRQSESKLNVKLGEAVSGALHDAAILAPHVPTAMLFIASKDGVSHNASELSRLEDIVTAARILNEVVSA